MSAIGQAIQSDFVDRLRSVFWGKVRDAGREDDYSLRLARHSLADLECWPRLNCASQHSRDEMSGQEIKENRRSNYETGSGPRSPLQEKDKTYEFQQPHIRGWKSEVLQ